MNDPALKPSTPAPDAPAAPPQPGPARPRFQWLLYIPIRPVLNFVLDIAAILVLGGIIVLFHPALALANTGLTDYDLFTYFHPSWHYRALVIEAGRLPLWDPYTFTGVPFLANIQTGVLYLPNLLMAPLEVSRALALSYLGHLWLAAAGMYVMLRLGTGTGVVGGLAGGIAFGLGGFLAAQAGHINQVQVASWLPLLTLGILQICRHVSIPWTVFTAVGFFMLITAGHPQETYLAAVAIGLLAIYEGTRWGVLAARRELGRFHPQLQPFVAPVHFVLRTTLGGALCALAAALGVLMAAVQLLPTLELIQFSSREGGLPIETAASFSLPPWEMLPTLLPTYQDQPFSEFNAYLGVVALSLAWLALMGWRTRGHIAYFAGISALGLFLAFGGYNPYYPFFYENIPGIDLFRVPARWLFLPAFGLAALAGLGMDILWRREHRAPTMNAVGHALAGVFPPIFLGAVIFVVAAAVIPPPPELAVAIWFAGGLTVLTICLFGSFLVPGKFLTLPLLLLLTVELWVAHFPLPVAHPVPAQVYTAIRPGLAQLMLDSSVHRILSLANPRYVPGDREEMRENLGRTLPEKEVEEYIVATKYKEAFNPNMGLRFGLAGLDGYDGGLLPLKDFADLKGKILASGDARPPVSDGPAGDIELIRDRFYSLPDLTLLANLNVKYVVMDRLYDKWVDGFYADLDAPQMIKPFTEYVLKDDSWDAATTLFVYSYLSVHSSVPPGDPVALVSVTDAEGAVYSWPLRSGIETAKTNGSLSVDEPDAGRVVGTKRGHPDQNIFLARFELTEPLVPRSITITDVVPGGDLTVAALVLADTRVGTSVSPPLDQRLTRIFTGDVKIYQLETAQPRVYVATNPRLLQPRKEQLNALLNLDPQDVFLDRLGEIDIEALDPGASGTARILSHRPEEVDVLVIMPAEGYLVLHDSYYPGWRAWVDGEETEVLRANYLFRAVVVPEGVHKVRFRYLPTTLAEGWVLTQLALVMMGLLLIGDLIIRTLKVTVWTARWIYRRLLYPRMQRSPPED